MNGAGAYLEQFSIVNEFVMRIAIAVVQFSFFLYITSANYTASFTEANTTNLYFTLLDVTNSSSLCSFLLLLSETAGIHFVFLLFYC